MRRRFVSMMLAVLLLFSLMSSAVSAAELKDENSDAAVAELGAGVPVITSLQSSSGGVRIEWSAIH